MLLGEFGSMQMELYSLSQRLGIAELGDLADYTARFLEHNHKEQVSAYKALAKIIFKFTLSKWKRDPSGHSQ